MKWQVTANHERFDEAVDWFQRRTVITADEAERLNADIRQRAFWIGAGLELEQIQRVFDSLVEAQEQGEPFDAWRKRVRGELRNDAHAETVFRNAVQRSLNAGRYRQMREPGVARFRPYWMFDAILDDRTTDICERRHKVILPHDHPFWRSNTPPLHHRCRSSLRSLRRTEAERRGITTVPPVDSPPEGFGLAPDAQPVWKPDPKRYDPALLAELERKSTAAPRRRSPPEKPPQVHDPQHWEKVYEPVYGRAAPAVGWGRAMLERGLDRSAADVTAEIQRLQESGAIGPWEWLLEHLRNLDQHRPLRSLVLTAPHRYAAALSEHTQAIERGPRLTLTGARHSALEPAKTFFEQLADKSVRLPHDWAVRLVGGVRSKADPLTREFLLGDVHHAPLTVHEIAHGIEYTDARALIRSVAFLRARTANDEFKRLVDIRPDDGFKDDEYTRTDQFIDEYIGKDYRGFATEVTSVGYEVLAGGICGKAHLAVLAERDPEMLYFLLGQLAGR